MKFQNIKMPFSACCYCNTKKSTKETTSGNNSPNVIDLYIDAFNRFEPITTQPYPSQRKPRPISVALVHDLKRYNNDPKGYNNFAFVDEIDFVEKSIKEFMETESQNSVTQNSVKNSNQLPSETELKSENLNELVENIDNFNNNINVLSNLDKSTNHKDNLTTSSSSDIINSNKCTVTITKNGEKSVQTFDLENSQFYNQNLNCIKIGNITISDGKILINPTENLRISNNINLEKINDNDYIIENAFGNFIENINLKPKLENLNLPKYATIKIHEEYLMLGTEVPRKIPKRKFPNAFDNKIEKVTDLKRKSSPTNLVISKVELLKEIPSDFRYASFRLASLNAHNEYRANHGCPPLVESNELNEIAKDWANHLAINNYEIYHRPNNKFGENLYWTTDSFGHAKMAVQAWYKEIELYDYNNPGFSNETGHFTQLLWKETKELGTGIAKIGNIIWVVCNYNPPGNVQGQFNDFYVPRSIK